MDSLVAQLEAPVDVGEAGDTDGLATLYALHYTHLLRTAALLLGDVAAGEDIVQEAFIRVARICKKNDLNVGGGYLHRTVVNLARSDLRRRLVALRHAPKADPDTPGADHDALAALQNDAVLVALRQLPRRQREAVVLRYYVDQSEAQTADLMGVSIGAVKAYASRGLAALRTSLEELG